MIEASAGVISAGEPVAEDPLTAHEMSAISEERLQELGDSLAKRRDDWITARKASGIERRWMEDLDQYNGRDHSTKMAASMMEAAEQGYPVTNRDSKPQRSTLYVNITRPKTNAAEARLANMLFPSDDRNWGLKPSPSPDLVKAALVEAKSQDATNAQTPPPAPPAPPQGSAPQPGQPTAAVTPSPMTSPAPTTGAPVVALQAKPTAQQQLSEAEERCKAMQDEIDDQLMDCQYNGEGRKVIHDAAVLGTGIFKGPIVVNKVRKAWTPVKGSMDKSVFVLELVKEVKPASESISPWYVFTDPSCGGDPHNGTGIFEGKPVTSKQLRELASQPGYLKDKIGEVIEEGPEDNEYQSEREQRENAESGRKVTGKGHFMLWEYWGEFSPEDMRAAGVDVPDDTTETVSGCVIIVNQTVIKGFLNPIETGDLPYDFVQWELVDDSPWGYGIPFLMRPAQRALNAAWRQLMDNAGLSVGPQFFIKQSGVKPADNIHQITGRKVWLVDDNVNIKDCFHTVDIPMHGQEIQQIIELAMKFADQEASVPELAQGEHGNAPDTVGGMTILMNSSNVVLSRMVKQFDDCITRPHLRRYYDWNMAYSDKANIKGDFQVDARGSSALLVKDLQAQSLLALGNYQQSPMLAPLVNWEAWFKQVLKLQHIDPTDIMKTEAEIAQLSNQPPPPPLPLLVEQAKGKNALELQAARTQGELQKTQQELQAEAQMSQNGGITPHEAGAQAKIVQENIRSQTAERVEASRSNAEEARAQKELEIAQQNGMFKLKEMEMQRDLAILDYTSKHNLKLEDVKAQLANTAIQETTKRNLAAAELQLAQNEGEADRAHDMAKHATSLIRDQVSTPLTP